MREQHSLPPAPNVIAEVENFIRRYAILPELAYLPLATWTVATYMSAAFDLFPYIALVSAAKRTGKTLVLGLLEALCAKARRITFPTLAALCRLMADTPTLLLDDAGPLLGKQVSERSQAIRAVLTAGNGKGDSVFRCDGINNEVKQFPIYGPKAFAVVGGLSDTVMCRSICITMRPKTAKETTTPFLQSQARAEAEPIRQLLAKWAEENQATVSTAYESMEDLGFLTDRDADLWMPLFAVCAVAALERLTELERCAIALSGTRAPQRRRQHQGDL